MTKARVAFAAAAACALLIAPERRAEAQLSSATNSTSGSSCSGSNNSDGFCGSSVAFSVPNTGTTFTSRYAWNVNADVGIFGNRATAGTASHHVNFNATAVGGYLLNIGTSRTGDLNRISDLLLCNGQADISGVTGTSNVALASGSLNLADPGSLGNGGSTTSLPFSQSSSATICRNSNGVAQAHALTFTWNGNVRSNSCEAAVRLGQSHGTVTGCDACQYPGSPSRTQANDGHFVTVSYTSLCGNGVIDACGGEQCDAGSANGAFGSCCDSNCTFKSAGTACTDGVFCNGADTCTGGSAACSVHAGDPCPGPDGDGNCSESCNEGADNCTAPDPNGAACSDGAFCNGTDTCGGGTCTVHAGNPCIGGTECADACNEAADDCFDLAGTACTDDGNVCTTDTCNGAGACGHPAGNAGTTCRPVAGDCDVAETCTGASPACPSDGFVAGGTECRAAAGFCDLAESCTGTGPACPADAFKPSSVECRADTGQCDVAENCTGSSAACPADGFEPAGTPCDDGDNCTSGDACDGSNACSVAIDVDTLCGACEHCDPSDGMCVPGPRPDCLQPTAAGKARLLIKDNPARDAADLVVWKWIKGEETTFADFGDPTTDTDYELCIFDAGTAVVQSVVPAGGTCGSLPCWRPLGSNGYKYINRDRTPDGILKLLLRAGTDGKAKIILKGKGENLPFEPAFLPMATPVVAQLHAAAGPQASDVCWETNHISLGPLYNAEDQFKAVDEGPMP